MEVYIISMMFIAVNLFIVMLSY